MTAVIFRLSVPLPRDLMKQPVILATALVAAIAAPLSAQTKRAFSYDDLARIHAVSDPQRSPDGKWVAYTVSTTDVEKDKHNRDVWMVSWDGKEQVQLTSSKDNESTPRWSPDGKYLAFLASRGDEDETNKGAQARLRRREEEGRAGVAPQSRRRRGPAAHRDQGRHRRLRVVARRQAPRARRERSRYGRRPSERGRVEAQDRAARRDRSLRLQERSVRLSRQA